MRGGVVENIFVRDVTVGTVGDAVLQIDFNYEEGANGPHKPVVRNLVVENMTVGKAPRVLDVQGFPGAEISGVRFYNSKFKGISKEDTVKEADVKLVDCVVETKSDMSRAFRWQSEETSLAGLRGNIAFFVGETSIVGSNVRYGFPPAIR